VYYSSKNKKSFLAELSVATAEEGDQERKRQAGNRKYQRKVEQQQEQQQ
jgi:hypothetical protein